MRLIRNVLIGLTVLLALVLTGCQGLFGPVTPGAKTVLFNGRDFTGWEPFIPDENINVRDVWSVKDGAIYCTGKPNGYMRTEREFKDYHLHVEWRWVAEPANSGVLLHCSGPAKVWPRCIEAQLKSGNAGDFVLIDWTGLTVDGRDRHDPDRQYVIVPKKQKSNETEPGQWNSYDIYCDKAAVSLYVNSVLQNEGTDATETHGWICLQSEGGPIEFRNIYIAPLD